MKRITVTLSDEVRISLSPLFKEVHSADDEGKPGMILAQVYQRLGSKMVFATCAFVKSEPAKKIKQIIDKET